MSNAEDITRLEQYEIGIEQLTVERDKLAAKVKESNKVPFIQLARSGIEKRILITITSDLQAALRENSPGAQVAFDNRGDYWLEHGSGPSQYKYVLLPDEFSFGRVDKIS